MQVSGYIDYAHRLKSENFEPYFERKKKLMPKPSDLSYYNWETQHSTSNSTPNFQVLIFLFGFYFLDFIAFRPQLLRLGNTALNVEFQLPTFRSYFCFYFVVIIISALNSLDDYRPLLNNSRPLSNVSFFPAIVALFQMYLLNLPVLLFLSLFFKFAFAFQFAFEIYDS
jgi:hypothetical protein